MTFNPVTGSLDFETLRQQYQRGGLRPTELVAAIFERIDICPAENIWIYQLPRDEIMAQARRLEAQGPSADRPLWGLPYAIKDNIDVAGHPTTAACPAFSYVPDETATVVERLNEAGALLIGKTNLDQFATGLVGTRSPYGACANPFDATYIAGGSSAGSAVAVASGLVSFALGTDTAGSGRVPAGFNNIVGLKPSKGLLSTKGVFPACRSLDCVSIFALTCEDALAVFKVGQAPDPADPFSREQPVQPDISPNGRGGDGFRFGVPLPHQLKFFDNAHYARLFEEAVAQLKALGGRQVDLDFAPFIETANLLYGGPWVAERLSAIKDFIHEQPEALYPVTRQIIERGHSYSAVDAYESYYRLRAYQKKVAPLWGEMDLLLVPTSGTIYTLAEVANEPLALNSNLGTYTNFVNLLDLCAWAVPNGFQPDGLPMGVTLIAPAFHEEQLAGIAAAFHRQRSPVPGVGTKKKEN